MYNGAVAVTLVLDERGALDGEPEISTVGLYEPREENEDIAELEVAIEDAVNRLGRRERKDDAAVEEVAAQAVRRTVNRLLGKKPMTMVHVIRLRSEEHTSELQSLMRISYAVFCLKKTTQ